MDSETASRFGDVVGAEEVAAFAHQLEARVLLDVVAFGGEADEEGAWGEGAEMGEDVRGAAEREGVGHVPEGVGTVPSIALLELEFGVGGGRVVGDGGAEDGDVAVVEVGVHGVEHLLGAADGDRGDVGEVGKWAGEGAVDDGDGGATARGDAGE